MSSAYEERVRCLGKLDSQDKGLAEQRRLKKQNETNEEAIKMYEHFLKTRWVMEGMDYKYNVKKAEKAISEIKKESEAKLKKDLSGKIEILERAKKDLKELEKTEKEYKKNITKSKKLIASNTKKIRKLKKGTDKCYERERKGEIRKKRARCPNGSRKNRKSGKCEKK